MSLSQRDLFEQQRTGLSVLNNLSAAKKHGITWIIGSNSQGQFYGFWSDDETARAEIDNEFINKFSTPMVRNMVQNKKGRIVSAADFDNELAEIELKNEILFLLKNSSGINNVQWFAYTNNSNQKAYAFKCEDAGVREMIDQEFLKLFNINLQKVLFGENKGRAVLEDDMRKIIEATRAHIEIEDQALITSNISRENKLKDLDDTYLKEPLFIRFLSENDVNIELAKKYDFKPCNLYVPFIPQRLLNTSLFFSTEQKIASRIDNKTIALIIDPRHPDSNLKYWSVKDSLSDSIHPYISTMMQKGEASLKMKPTKTYARLGFRPAKIRLNSENKSKEKFLDDFSRKLMKLETLRQSNDETYKTSSGKTKQNIYKGDSATRYSTILEHNEGGVSFSEKSIVGIFIPDATDKETVAKALETKEILQIVYHCGHIYFATAKDATMENGLLIKLNEDELRLSLKPKTPGLN